MSYSHPFNVIEKRVSTDEDKVPRDKRNTGRSSQGTMKKRRSGNDSFAAAGGVAMLRNPVDIFVENGANESNEASVNRSGPASASGDAKKRGKGQNKSDTSGVHYHSALDPESNLFKALQAKWDGMFNKLVRFKKEYGHVCVPNRYEKDRALGAWVSTQRRYYKVLRETGNDGKKQSSLITLARIRRLNEIDFVWKAVDPRHTPWATRYEQLVDFCDEYGTCLVSIPK